MVPPSFACIERDRRIIVIQVRLFRFLPLTFAPQKARKQTEHKKLLERKLWIRLQENCWLDEIERTLVLLLFIFFAKNFGKLLLSKTVEILKLQNLVLNS